MRIARDGTVTPLVDTGRLPPAPGTITEVETIAEDGARVRGWLLLPEGASDAAPAPLLLWIHGGPLTSWNAWSWRWAPLLAVARGYAVLLPDPALSTGYGLEFIARGWNSWGGKPYTDLMSITDAAIARPDIDESKTAAMGGSFGGYMANWVAGHTDRFRAIVTHASLWAMDQFGGTTDSSEYWQRIFTPEAMIENSPHRFVDGIRTPILVIHGDRDYRVPIGESLRLWSELAEHHAAADGIDRAPVPVLPGREPLGAEAPARRASGTRPSSRSWTSTCTAPIGSAPNCSADLPRRRERHVCQRQLRAPGRADARNANATDFGDTVGMSTKVSLTHYTGYTFARPVNVTPHVVRLRPAPHSRTPIEAYSLDVSPANHFINWQQDPFGNWVARLVFPEKIDHLVDHGRASSPTSW